MGTQSALFKTEDQIACALKQVAEKPAGRGPAESHYAPRDARDDQCKQQLLGANPGADGCAKFQIAHTHAAQKPEDAEEQRSNGQPSEALPDPAPAVKPARDADSRNHEGKHQPIRNAATAQIGERRNREDNQSRPPGDRIHTQSLSPRLQGVPMRVQFAIQIPDDTERLELLAPTRATSTSV